MAGGSDSEGFGNLFTSEKHENQAFGLFPAPLLAVGMFCRWTAGEAGRVVGKH
ncbi:MAG: hypothetical protein IH592_09090 [Bacteroidales bacterium]|nr:hypothetical protein [Bacteroidales bacterium]